MSDIFPKWTNQLPAKVLLGAALVGTGVVAGMWYYLTPKYSRVGYQPVQPVPFSHAVHADQLGIDCRYCHNAVEKSWYSNVPATSTCMNCHTQVLKDDPRLELVRDSFKTGQPIPWVQIHITPDFVYFNHSVHVNRGISCVKCHGPINHMDEVHQVQPLSMTFCLDCHRHPGPNLRPLDKITALDWKPEEHLPSNWGQQRVKEWNIDVPALENCSTCHR
ncbi:MAG: cytochrome c family protein [Verrucomicrobia bacterium]|nr:cytochrome c family protein [Verrucomicrobiota bacterium]